MVPFLEKKAVPLGFSALPSVKVRTEVHMLFPQEVGATTPRHEGQPRPCLFCLLAEDVFAFAIKKMT